MAGVRAGRTGARAGITGSKGVGNVAANVVNGMLSCTEKCIVWVNKMICKVYRRTY